MTIQETPNTSQMMDSKATVEEMVSGNHEAVSVEENGEKHMDHNAISSVDNNDHDNELQYTDADEEPDLHARTWLAILSMFLLNLVQVFALQGPPAVVSKVDRRWQGVYMSECRTPGHPPVAVFDPALYKLTWRLAVHSV